MGGEEMQENGWGVGAGGEVFGRHGDGAGEAAAGEPQGRRSIMLGWLAPWTKGCEQGMAEPAAAPKKLLSYGISIKRKKRGLKCRLATYPALRATQASSTPLLSIALLHGHGMVWWGQAPSVSRWYGEFFPLKFYKLWLKSLGLCSR